MVITGAKAGKDLENDFGEETVWGLHLEEFADDGCHDLIRR